MNVLFLTLLDFYSIKERNIYTDLLREFVKNGHKIYAISPVERRNKKKTELIQESDWSILKLKIGNTQKTNVLEKGISTICIERQFIAGIRKYFGKVKFHLVMYSTPPITLCKAVDYVKKRDKARSYLLLKDIFPQNAVDMGMMKKSGVKGILYRYFREKEKKLYEISDTIGCMSEANVTYVLRHNPEVRQRNQKAKEHTGRGIVEVCPNSIEPVDLSLTENERVKIRKKYGLPLDKIVFVYGGNLGKPQGIGFLIQCLKRVKDRRDCFFLIIGDGTEYSKLEKYMKKHHPVNIRLMRKLEKADYEQVAGACDVGMIFLDHRFTIPNIPSRMLSYMTVKLPVLAVTDSNTDLGKIVVGGKFGWWCESNCVDGFASAVENCLLSDLKEYGKNGFWYMEENYSVKVCYSVIDHHIENKKDLGGKMKKRNE